MGLMMNGTSVITILGQLSGRMLEKLTYDVLLNLFICLFGLVAIVIIISFLFKLFRKEKSTGKISYPVSPKDPFRSSVNRGKQSNPYLNPNVGESPVKPIKKNPSEKPEIDPTYISTDGKIIDKEKKNVESEKSKDSPDMS